MIHHEQGLGDTIQFSRYIELVSKMAAKVYFAPQFQLMKLFDGRFGCEIIDPNPDKLPEFDTYVPCLVYLWLSTLGFFPSQTRLHIFLWKVQRSDEWKQKIGREDFKIGICWQGNSSSNVDWGRSFPVSQFEPLARLPGVRLISLHKGEGEGQLNSLPGGMKVETLGNEFDRRRSGFP